MAKMSLDSTFSVALHVSHPNIPAAEILGVFKLPVRFSQSVGDKRKTKNGHPLDGHYKRTNISFSLHDKPLPFSEISIHEIMMDQLNAFNIE